LSANHSAKPEAVLNLLNKTEEDDLI